MYLKCRQIDNWDVIQKQIKNKEKNIIFWTPNCVLLIFTLSRVCCPGKYQSYHFKSLFRASWIRYSLTFNVTGGVSLPDKRRILRQVNETKCNNCFFFFWYCLNCKIYFDSFLKCLQSGSRSENWWCVIVDVFCTMVFIQYFRLKLSHYGWFNETN